MKYLIAYVIWIVAFCLLLTLSGWLLDVFNPRPYRLPGYFEMYLEGLFLPTWMQNILILILINGVAALKVPQVKILFSKDFNVWVFPMAIIGVNFISIVVIIFGFLIVRAILFY